MGGSASPARLLLGQLNRCVAVLGTGAVSRIYAQLRPLRNVRALLPPSRLAAVQGASKQCEVRRGSRRAVRGVRGRRRRVLGLVDEVFARQKPVGNFLLVSYSPLASSSGAKKGSSVFTAVLRALNECSATLRCTPAAARARLPIA